MKTYEIFATRIKSGYDGFFEYVESGTGIEVVILKESVRKITLRCSLWVIEIEEDYGCTG